MAGAVSTVRQNIPAEVELVAVVDTVGLDMVVAIGLAGFVVCRVVQLQISERHPEYQMFTLT